MQAMGRDLGKPLTEVELVVPAEDAGLRLDHFLAEKLPWRSRSDLQRRVRDGLISVNGEPARPAQRVQPGMLVRVLVTESPGINTEVPATLPFRILLEDPWLLALDKPPGAVVHPVGRHVNDTLLNVLHARHARLSGPAGLTAPMIVHRLDKDTSGVLVFASDEEARRRLGLDFETRRVRKSYLALVHGCVSAPDGVIDLPVGPDTTHAVRTKMAVTAEGRPSRTRFETLFRSATLSLVRFLPETGRQHQIRVHAEAIGHPILCDRLYGVTEPDPETPRVFSDAAGHELARQALHAEALLFRHPGTDAEVLLHAPLAPDLAALLPAGLAPPAAPPLALS